MCLLSKRRSHGIYLKEKQKKRKRGSTSPQQPTRISQRGFHPPRLNQNGIDDQRGGADREGWTHARPVGRPQQRLLWEQLRRRMQPTAGASLHRYNAHSAGTAGAAII